MSTSCCSPAAADLQPDDLLQEVFLRLPPEPGALLAASLVCRRWCRLVRGRAFLRRFRASHRAPPVLGFFQNLWALSGSPSPGKRVRFVPTAAPAARLSSPPGFPGLVLDCRHGRVLLYSHADRGKFLIWDPMTGDTRYSVPPLRMIGEDVTAAVVCAAGHEDHTDCHSSPFRVVLLDCKENDRYCWATTGIYSSQTESWGDWAAIKIPSLVSTDSSALVGNSLYWKSSDILLEVGLHGPSLRLIKLPELITENYMADIHIMQAEDGSIGFAGVNYSSVHLWSRRIDSEGKAGWALLRMIDMDKLTLSGVPTGDMFLWSSVVAFARESDELFLQSEDGIFIVNIRSMQLRKVLGPSGSAIYPYASFYTRGRDIVGIDDRDE